MSALSLRYQTLYTLDVMAKINRRATYSKNDFFSSLKLNAEKEHLKLDLTGDKFDIILAKPPTIPDLEEYLSDFENKSFIHFLDILTLYPDFIEISKTISAEKVQKRKALFNKLFKEKFPRIPKMVYNNIYPYFSNNKHRGFSIYNQFRLNYENKYTRRNRDFINFGKTPYKTLLRNIIMLNYFKISRAKNDRIKLVELKDHWMDFSKYYGLPTLPSMEHLAREKAKFFKLLQ